MKNNVFLKIIDLIVLCVCFVPAMFIIFICNFAEFLENTVSNINGYQPNPNKNPSEPPKGTSGEDA